MLFFFNDTATTEIYTLSLHDALPISVPTGYSEKSKTTSKRSAGVIRIRSWETGALSRPTSLPTWMKESPLEGGGDRKSTRLNSSHANISYAVFCLKKKNFCMTKQ